MQKNVIVPNFPVYVYVCVCVCVCVCACVRAYVSSVNILHSYYTLGVVFIKDIYAIYTYNSVTVSKLQNY